MIAAPVIFSLSSGAEDSEEINEDYDKGYSELNNEIDGQVIEKSYFQYKVWGYWMYKIAKYSLSFSI